MTPPNQTNGAQVAPGEGGGTMGQQARAKAANDTRTPLATFGVAFGTVAEFIDGARNLTAESVERGGRLSHIEFELAKKRLPEAGLSTKEADAWVRLTKLVRKTREQASAQQRRAASSPDEGWRAELVYRETKSGPVLDDVTANANVALRFHPAWKGVVAFDVFQQTIVVTKRPPWGPNEAPPQFAAGPWTDEDSARLQMWLRREVGLKLGRDAVDSALLVAAKANPIDPPREYVESLVWDGVPRVDNWLSKYVGVTDSDYSRTVGAWALIGSIARLFEPGCKMDTALVLEGEQGAKKSTAIKVLFGDWHSDTPLDLNNKDRFSSIQGVWGYELAEFDAYSKHEASVIKAFMSSPSDKYRPPYLRRDVKVPRRVAFWLTINPGKEYLQDETGGRRYHPVRVGEIDIVALQRDRDQLWAEARAKYQAGEKWYPTTAEERTMCGEQQADRQATDAWEEPIRAKLIDRTEVTIGEMMSDALGLEKSRWDRASQMRVGAVLRASGYERTRASSGSRQYIYRKKASAENANDPAADERDLADAAEREAVEIRAHGRCCSRCGLPMTDSDNEDTHASVVLGRVDADARLRWRNAHRESK